jgi:hypothetical protein
MRDLELEQVISEILGVDDFIMKTEMGTSIALVRP